MSVRVLEGHVLNVLPQMDPESVQMCVTSIPYWQLRDYGTPLQIWGGDPLCAHSWETERYYREGGASGSSSQAFSAAGPANAQRLKDTRWRENTLCASCGAWLGEWGQEPTPEMYVEHTVSVFAAVRRVLRKDGTLWLNIGDTYWNDPGGQNGGQGVIGQKAKDANAAVGRRKRATGAVHPTLKRKDLCGIPWRVALALQADGWWLRSDVIWSKPNALPENVTDRPTRSHEYLFLLTKGQRYFYDADAIKEPFAEGTADRYAAGFNVDRYSQATDTGGFRGAFGGKDGQQLPATGRNKRSVWSVPVSSLTEAHFAVFPPSLIEPCIKAGSAPGDVVLDTCGGSGTTGIVADRLGRDAVLVELKHEYAEMCRRRVYDDSPMFAEVVLTAPRTDRAVAVSDLLEGLVPAGQAPKPTVSHPLPLEGITP